MIDSFPTLPEEHYFSAIYIFEHLLVYSVVIIGGCQDAFRSCQGYSSVGLWYSDLITLNLKVCLN